MGLKLSVRGGWAAALCCVAPAVFADTVYLEDGSRINGEIVSLSANSIMMDTAFADSLTISRNQIEGLASDDTLKVLLSSGRQTEARFAYDAQPHTQRIDIGDDAGNESLTLDDIAEIAPAVVDAQQDEDDYELPNADSLPPENGDYWSGSAEVALNGKSGNTDTSSLLTRVSALRDTGGTRLSLSASADREEEDNETTSEEYLGEARFEDDLTQRLFWFLQQELEKDEFEDIDLRSRTLIGPGYFLARRDRLTFKVRGGIGHQYEKYTSGGNNSELIFSAGWDYAQLVGEWLTLTHEFTAYPEVTNSPSENFILESALGVELPIANSDVWRLRAGLDHKYNNNPEPGVEDLDTTYNFGVLRNF